MNPLDKRFDKPHTEPLVIVVEHAGGKASERLRAALPGADFVSAPIEFPEAVPDAVLVIDASRNGAEVTAALLASRGLAGRGVLVTPKRDIAALAAALRAGVADVVALSDADFDDSLKDSVARIWSRVLRSSDRRACRRAAEAGARADKALNRRLLAQIKLLCADLASTCQGLGMELATVALASEVNALFRQELDLESLLRTALEFTLRKVGPTNAAIFLRNTCDDFEVGAYANYDTPRDSCEDMLGSLAACMPESVGTTQPALFHSADDIVGVLGHLPAALRDSSVLAIGCSDGGEAGALLVLFRDRRQGFGDVAHRTLRIVGRAFGEQAERIRRTQVRHLGKSDWMGAKDPEPGEDPGLAA